MYVRPDVRRSLSGPGFFHVVFPFPDPSVWRWSCRQGRPWETAGIFLRKDLRFQIFLQNIGQIAHVDDIALAEIEGVLQGIFQLPYVSLPVIVLKGHLHQRADAPDGFSHSPVEMIDKIVGEYHHVRLSVPQRRNVDSHHADSVEQIRAHQPARSTSAGLLFIAQIILVWKWVLFALPILRTCCSSMAFRSLAAWKYPWN